MHANNKSHSRFFAFPYTITRLCSSLVADLPLNCRGVPLFIFVLCLHLLSSFHANAAVIWISHLNLADGVYATSTTDAGTQTNPYDGSGIKFQVIIEALENGSSFGVYHPDPYPKDDIDLRIVGSHTYLTTGIRLGSEHGTWKISGSGVKPTIKHVPSLSMSYTSVTDEVIQAGNFCNNEDAKFNPSPLTYFELKDVRLDCNWREFGTGKTAGVRSCALNGQLLRVEAWDAGATGSYSYMQETFPISHQQPVDAGGTFLISECEVWGPIEGGGMYQYGYATGISVGGIYATNQYAGYNGSTQADGYHGPAQAVEVSSCEVHGNNYPIPYDPNLIAYGVTGAKGVLFRANIAEKVAAAFNCDSRTNWDITITANTFTELSSGINLGGPSAVALASGFQISSNYFDLRSTLWGELYTADRYQSMAGAKYRYRPTFVRFQGKTINTTITYNTFEYNWQPITDADPANYNGAHNGYVVYGIDIDHLGGSPGDAITANHAGFSRWPDTNSGNGTDTGISKSNNTYLLHGGTLNSEND